MVFPPGNQNQMRGDRRRSPITLVLLSVPVLKLLDAVSSNAVSSQTLYKPTGYGSSSRRAPQTGIVDECCFRSCDLRRLEMYCAPLKPAKAARSVRAQRHTDMPKAQKYQPPSTNKKMKSQRRRKGGPKKHPGGEQKEGTEASQQMKGKMKEQRRETGARN
ncbi:hypothetical protein FD755_002880 [Muntiacus reevesi]|uniref:Insulin-like growth factor 1 n=1 Tax=Muntiacus reevesi TaxID=9886 RepID=A0A5J5N7E8_MUNRE|nr:hypothetical protein FD755_002880 [Muntiacus reevesi]